MKILKLYNMLLFHNYKFLKFDEFSPNFEYLIEFLEINGKNLKEVHLGDYCINSLNLAIAKFCPNLKLLNTGFKEYDVEILKVILNSCQQLESIKVWGGDNYHLNECELLEVVTKDSPKMFHELKIIVTSYLSQSVLFLEELEPVFISWSNRIPQKPLSLIILDGLNGTRIKKESMEVIEKFKKLGVIKKFEIIKYDS